MALTALPAEPGQQSVSAVCVSVPDIPVVSDNAINEGDTKLRISFPCAYSEGHVSCQAGRLSGLYSICEVSPRFSPLLLAFQASAGQMPSGAVPGASPLLLPPAAPVIVAGSGVASAHPILSSAAQRPVSDSPGMANQALPHQHGQQPYQGGAAGVTTGGSATPLTAAAAAAAAGADQRVHTPPGVGASTAAASTPLMRTHASAAAQAAAGGSVTPPLSSLPPPAVLPPQAQAGAPGDGAAAVGAGGAGAGSARQRWWCSPRMPMTVRVRKAGQGGWMGGREVMR